MSTLLTTALHPIHLQRGAKMVPFAGYDMPVQYPTGVLAEHRHVRQAVGLFDVSHMGQIQLQGPDAAAALETLVPVDVVGLREGQQRYAFFTSPEGGILDDLMIVRPHRSHAPDTLYLVVNAACKDADLAHLQKHIGHRCQIQALTHLALIALQGPQAFAVLQTLQPAINNLNFMTGQHLDLAGIPCFITRSGYTGEDGFEISVPADQATALTQALLNHPQVWPIGLGARDTLRLEAGLCLYGHDINTSTSPIEAGLQWAIQKVRRPNGERAGGYPGAQRIEHELANGTARRRVGLVGLEKAPVREGADISHADGSLIGKVTSGTLGPSLGQPIAMAWITSEYALLGETVFAQVRGKALPMRISPMPFVPHRYFRSSQ